MAQDIGYALVQFMGKRIKANTPSPLVLGSLPAGAIVLHAGSKTITPFEGGGDPKVGTAEEPDAYASVDEAEVVTAATEVVVTREVADIPEGDEPPKGEAVAYVTF